MNQRYFPEQPSWRNEDDANTSGDVPHHRPHTGHGQRDDAGPPPPPPEPQPFDPRNDPRWVHSPHDSRDESREIPYFYDPRVPAEHSYQPYQLPPQGPPQKPRRRGPLSALITGAGIIGFAILLLGLLSQVFDWDTESNPVQEFFDPTPEAPEVIPDGEGSVDSLIAGLDHVHEGIAVDWEAGGQHTGPGLDPGQEVAAAPGVFMVDTQVYQYLGFGTGMVVSSEGLAITNYHVVESSMSVGITMADTDQQYSATVLGRDAEKDIAVLQIETEQPLPVASINADGVQTGETVAGVGNAGGQGYLTSVVGRVGGLNETIHIEPQEPGSQGQWLEGLIMITSDIVPGYSGGPTVDNNGQVIGVSTAASQDTTNTEEAFGYAVPITSALEVVEQVIAGDDSGSVVIGAGGALGIVVGSDEAGGARVMEITPGSAGESIGLQPGDIITQIDGQEVVNSSFISRYVRDRNPGDEVEVVWQTEAGDTQAATAVLDEAEIN